MIETRGQVFAEAPHDLPVRCECCVIPRRLEPQFVGADKPLRMKCPSSGAVYFQKKTAAGVLVLAGFEVA